ncbi:MAG: hypothetical protein JEY97_00955 [Bacteroidales bacterium]|nr:hypothetical protein [Bacteroidales bacterium]
MSLNVCFNASVAALVSEVAARFSGIAGSYFFSRVSTARISSSPIR